MSKYEQHIYKILTEHNVRVIKEKTFQDLRRGLFRYDFYLPNIPGGPLCIEIDGAQHFQQVKKFQPTLQDFKKTQEYDRRKNSYCLANNIPLYRIPYWEIYQIKTLQDIFQEKFRVKDRWHNDKLKINS